MLNLFKKFNLETLNKWGFLCVFPKLISAELTKIQKKIASIHLPLCTPIYELDKIFIKPKFLWMFHLKM